MRLPYTLTPSRRVGVIACLFGLALTPRPALAQSAEEMARLLQDPLASISALMTDNTVNFGTGTDELTGYNFQLQPVYSISFDTFNFIPRGVVPIVGAPGGADFPNLGPPQPPGPDVKWGLSDIMVQTFFNPKSASDWKWGVGPQFSFKSRTSERVAGPGWGSGLGAVMVGGAGDFAFAFLTNQHWSFDGDFSLMTVQPMIFYNIPSLPGATIHFNNSITIDWKATSGNKWTVPLGLGVSQTLDMGGGYALDLSIGGYGIAVRPEAGPRWQLKFGITLLTPR